MGKWQRDWQLDDPTGRWENLLKWPSLRLTCDSFSTEIRMISAASESTLGGLASHAAPTPRRPHWNLAMGASGYFDCLLNRFSRLPSGSRK
jgi:hypothetical protein